MPKIVKPIQTKSFVIDKNRLVKDFIKITKDNVKDLISIGSIIYDISIISDKKVLVNHIDFYRPKFIKGWITYKNYPIGDLSFCNFKFFSNSEESDLEYEQNMKSYVRRLFESDRLYVNKNNIKVVVI